MTLGAADPRYNPNAIGCPHPALRERAMVQVTNAQGEAMDLCRPCHRMFEEFRARWAAGDLSEREVRTRMRLRGYDARDADQILQDLQEAA